MYDSGLIRYIDSTIITACAERVISRTPMYVGCDVIVLHSALCTLHYQLQSYRSTAYLVDSNIIPGVSDVTCSRATSTTRSACACRVSCMSGRCILRLYLRNVCEDDYLALSICTTMIYTYRKYSVAVLPPPHRVVLCALQSAVLDTTGTINTTNMYCCTVSCTVPACSPTPIWGSCSIWPDPDNLL